MNENEKELNVSVDFNPIEMGFIQASIDLYLEEIKKKAKDDDQNLDEFLVTMFAVNTGKSCLDKINKAIKKADEEGGE